jgi:DNA-binding HxlR family transcriptional regulator
VDFRYAQFCPLTRAVEILGERWTILILRELFLGPKRFSDLKAALNGVSTSVLAERLGRLEERGILLRRELPPPSASTVYELDDAGRALRPLLAEMTRWGLRFLGAPGRGDTFRPEWLSLGFEVFARSTPSQQIGAKIHIDDGSESLDLYVRGGAGGTVVSRDPLPFDVTIRATPIDILMFASGLSEPGEGSPVQCEGDPGIARAIPSLFDFRATPGEPDANVASRSGAIPARTRPRSKPAATSSRNSAAEGSRKLAAKGSRTSPAADRSRIPPAADRSGTPPAADRSRKGAKRP